MNQQCKVCGEPAAGFHFGAFTCEGCKSFFGRTYNNLGSISECKNGGNCVINKKNRTACKACRLRKCLYVGMSKSGSRYGRRSNWFKIHCLLQEQTNSNHSGITPNPFGTNYLPNFMASSQTNQNVFKDNDRTSPNNDDHILQSQLLHYSMMKQVRNNKSPHSDDALLQNQLKLLAWHKEQERAGQQHQKQIKQQNIGTPPRDCTSPTYAYKHPSTIYPQNFPQKEMIIPSSPEVFRPFSSTPLPYKRTAETPSDSGTSISSHCDVNDNDESRSNSAMSYFKGNTSPTLSERDYTPKKINSSLSSLANQYNPFPQINCVYPPPGLVTPATSQHSPRGGDLLLVSPNHALVAVQQDEPIDLSIRSTHSSLRRTISPDNYNNNNNDRPKSRCSINEETTIKGKPLDLTLSVKRPIELGLSI
ncbi:hypothetical protein HCN44_002088 [Aphidius gifuensis]|uniref:Nuclear receptor domain-containing protein n=1 Tax=Aphidius gifuensis TaxID=684658 RepID=A0A834Y1W5_APHGI|nr:protein embryonic gonad-like [Aphidius gifuensis]KAF7996456.1 hypothetical protein HCN44_002088 [Aphidius gifuensis]